MSSENLSNSLNKKFNIIYILFVLLIIFFGIFVRTKVYLLNAPFWVDECMMSHSFIDRNIWGIFNPLDCGQKSPPLFLFCTFIIVKLFGFNEYSFRLIPFLSSISSLIAFYFLLKQFLKNKFCILLGLYLFAISVQSIYYAAEFKSYSLDILVCIILLLSYKYIHLKNLSFKKTILYTFISVIFVLFSYTAGIIIPAMLAAKCIEEKKISVNAVLILLGIIGIYIHFRLSDIYTNNFMKSFWFNDFFICSRIINSFSFLFNNYTFYFKICFPILFCIGFYTLYKEKNNYLFLFSFLFIIPVITSLIKMYPFENRLVLYMLPILIILIVKSLESKVIKNDTARILIKEFVCILLFLLVIKIPLINIPEKELVYRYNDRNRSYIERICIKDASLYIINNYREGDKILASEEFIYFINYYIKRYNLKKINFSTYGFRDSYIERCRAYIIAKDFIKENKNKSKIWFIGRDNDEYFRCASHKEIEQLLNMEDLNYQLMLSYNKEIYIINTKVKR